MDKKTYNLDNLRGKQPFSVPKGYMDGLTDRIMNQIPEKRPQAEEPLVISWADRVRPWLYLAAVFAGLGIFFKTIVGVMPQTENKEDSLLVQSERPLVSPDEIQDEQEEDLEYLEYIEMKYSDDLIANELNGDE
ncbi:hypothetical protein JQM83_08825 [Parabacteroides distasonis]|nr:hypothetical protein [Parabacteroides distasonis]MCI6875689.1 hypothetical protein [Parabacteroides sp.]MDD6099427.1 hypothetical protein [bacterium]MDD7631863.1 hypothetical protein [bacterium]MDD7721400.1 hypothetical protein [bacterium]